MYHGTLYHRIRLNTAQGPALKGTELLGLQSHFGDKPFKLQVFRPQNGIAVVKGTLTVLKNIRNTESRPKGFTPYEISKWQLRCVL